MTFHLWNAVMHLWDTLLAKLDCISSELNARSTAKNWEEPEYPYPTLAFLQSRWCHCTRHQARGGGRDDRLPGGRRAAPQAHHWARETGQVAPPLSHLPTGTTRSCSAWFTWPSGVPRWTALCTPASLSPQGREVSWLPTHLPGRMEPEASRRADQEAAGPAPLGCSPANLARATCSRDDCPALD